MSLSKRKIDLLREFVDFTCEECHKKEKKVGTLEPHKINPELGYILTNIKMVCAYVGKIGRKYSCHKIFTSAQKIASGIQG